MFKLNVYMDDSTLSLKVLETSIKNIAISPGGTQSTIIATPKEVFNVPSDFVWELTPESGPEKPSLATLVESTDEEDLETLAKLLREGLAADPCPFSRVGAAKSFLSKITKLAKKNP